MNHDDVRNKLNDYVDGDLPIQEQVEVRTHLEQCADCRREFAKLQTLMARTAALPKSITPERDLWAGIEQRVSQRMKGIKGMESSDPQSSRIIRLESRAFWRSRVIAIAATVAVMVGGFWIASRTTATAWNVASLQGKVRVGNGQIEKEGKLRVGELLETDAASRARVEVGLIGHVDVEPNSRLRLIDASLTEHRLALDRGTIHASIFAPPRLFLVQTPSALAVDLGCAYTLYVDSTGASILEVTSGWVALEFGGRESIVPAGNLCTTRPGFGPGTPFRDDASDSFKQALTMYDFESGGRRALKKVLAEARNMDSITLWHLLFRETGATRAEVYDRLAELVPAPEGVTRDGLLHGNPDMIRAWQKHLNLGAEPWWKFWQ